MASQVVLIFVLNPPTLLPMAWSLFVLFFFGSSTMLVGSDNGRINHRIFIIGIFAQNLEYLFPNTCLAPSGVSQVNYPKVPQSFGEISPGYSGSVSI